MKKNKLFFSMLSIVLIISLNCFNVNAYGYGAYLVGMSCADGADRYKWISNTYNAVACLRCSQSTMGRYATGEGLNEALVNSEVFIVHTHGSRTTVQCTSSDGTITRLTTNMIDNRPNNAYSHLKLAVFGTCNAGEGGQNSSNIVNSVHGRGADVVIGFRGKTWVSQINQYLTTFLNSIGEDRETYQKGMQDGVYWAKFWNFGKAGGTDNPYTRGTITKTYFD